MVRIKAETAAEILLELLSLRGIEYFFANAGTDFVAIVEALAKGSEQGKAFPKPVVVPHETPLLGMAYGYYLATGRPQFAMVLVGVGTANGLGMLMAANRAQVPILFSAGRSPVEGEGRFSYVHWGQDLYDQAGIVREQVKWYYELRSPFQLEAVIDRALAMALSEPKGPVYLILPPEVMASPVGEVEVRSEFPYDLPSTSPDLKKIERLAELLLEACFPLLITSSLGRSPEAVEALIELSERAAVAVVTFNPEYMNFPTDHPCHLGFSPDPFLPVADLILVVDCDVPWYPERAKPPSSTVVVQIGTDPLYSRYPARTFPSHLTVQGDPATVLRQLVDLLAEPLEGKEEALRSRRERLARMHEEIFAEYLSCARAASSSLPLDPDWVSYNVKEVLGDEAIVVNEYDNGMKPFMSQLPGHYFCNPHAGYLGWGLGTALGIKLGLPDRTVVATVGDGSYIFSVPSACHSLAAAHKLPILTIVYNNRCWKAVRDATRNVYPQGWASRGDCFPLSELYPGQYEKICEAFGGYGERVERPEEVGPALERALRVVQQEGRQALLNVICKVK